MKLINDFSAEALLAVIFLFSLPCCISAEKEARQGLPSRNSGTVCGSEKFKEEDFSPEGIYDLKSSSGPASVLVLGTDGTAVYSSIIENSECRADTVMKGSFAYGEGTMIVRFGSVSPGKTNTCALHSKRMEIEDVFRLKTGVCTGTKVLKGHFTGSFFIKRK